MLGYNVLVVVVFNFIFGILCWFNFRLGRVVGFGVNSLFFNFFGVEWFFGGIVYGFDMFEFDCILLEFLIIFVIIFLILMIVVFMESYVLDDSNVSFGE